MKRQQKLLVTDPALRALRAAVAKVVEDHRQRGKPLAVWRNGKAVWISAEAAGVLSETAPTYGSNSDDAKS